MTDELQIEKARRERFENVARQYMGKFPTLHDLEQPFKFGPDGDEYLEESIQFAWEMWREAGQAERREGMLEAAKIADVWGNSHSCKQHDDNPCCHVRTGAAITSSVREAAGRIETTPNSLQNDSSLRSRNDG